MKIKNLKVLIFAFTILLMLSTYSILYFNDQSLMSAGVSNNNPNDSHSYKDGKIKLSTLEDNNLYLKEYNTTWGGWSIDNGYGVVVDGENNVYISGETYSFGAGSDDAFLVKYDPSGLRLWNVTWGGASSDYGYDVAVDGENNVYINGYTAGGGGDALLAKYNPNGVQLWNLTWGGSAKDDGCGVAVDGDNNVYINGETYSFGAGNNDAFLVMYSKLDSFSIYTPIGWSKNQTPTVVAKFCLEKDGINISSVQYAYSTTGSVSPNNWAQVDGVYEDPLCTNLAENGDTGWLYAKVNAVPFGQDSDVFNTIRFRAKNLNGNLGIQGNTSIIKIDTTSPSISFNITNGNYYNSPPTVQVNFTDSFSLDDAYYKIDSYTPSGFNTTGWTAIFTDNPGNKVTTNFKVSSSIWNSLTEGLHVIYFKAWDDLNNINNGSAPSWNFYKDISIGKITDVKVNQVVSYMNSFVISWTNPNDLSGIIGVYYKVDSPPSSNKDGTYVAGVNISQIIVNMLDSGNHTIYIWLVDSAGNVNYTNYVKVDLQSASLQTISTTWIYILIIVISAAAVGLVLYFKYGKKKK